LAFSFESLNFDGVFISKTTPNTGDNSIFFIVLSAVLIILTKKLKH